MTAEAFRVVASDAGRAAVLLAALDGCEACHGPGQAHVEAANAGRAKSTALVPVTEATCVRCHDPENSPQFAYAQYWPRIAHALDGAAR